VIYLRYGAIKVSRDYFSRQDLDQISDVRRLQFTSSFRFSQGRGVLFKMRYGEALPRGPTPFLYLS